MNQRLRRLCVPLLLVTAVLATPVQVVGQDAACGADAPAGLVLHHAFDANGKSLDPPLALVDPTGSVRRAVAVPEPREIVPLGFDCRAIVRSATGDTFLVDGTSGEALPLDLGDPVADLRYDSWSGGRRWGLFRSNSRLDMWATAMVVDFSSGAATELATLLPPEAGVIWMAAFSPSGDYLVASSHQGGQWLVPLADRGAARAIGDSFFVAPSFDDAERRVLYAITGDDGRQELVVEDLEDGTATLIAAAPPQEGVVPSLSGWFLPGQNAIAVRYPDRFGIFHLDDATAGEPFVLEGAFGWFKAAPSGTRGVLASDVPVPSNVSEIVEPILTWVDLENQETRPIAGPAGEPVRVVGSGERWFLLDVGAEGAPIDSAAFDIETGTMIALPPLAGEELDPGASRFSTDGRVGLLITSVAGGGERAHLVDAQGGTLRDLAEADGVSAALSPDGSWAAVSTLHRTDDGRTMALTMVDTQSGEAVPLGPGLTPHWLGP